MTPSTRYWLLLIGLLAGNCDAKDVYVDLTLSNTCVDYSISARGCGDGVATAAPTLKEGLLEVRPGDRVLLREGEYRQLSIDVSGTQQNPVRIEPYANELVEVTDADGLGFRIVGQTDISIRGILVRNVVGFGRIQDSTRVSFDRMSFRDAAASGTTGALKFVRSSENVVSNSHFSGGSDLLLLQDSSDRNLVIRNRFESANHSLVSIRCANRNVIEGNTFSNPMQKALEIFDCEGISDAPVRLDSTRRNIIQRNWFQQTASSDRNYKFNAIQHGGQHTIVRKNLFTGNRGGGVAYQFYDDESRYVYGNRLYNNTFTKNRCGAIIGQSGSRKYMYDNIALNNLVYANEDCSGGGRQISIASRRAVQLVKNLVAADNPGIVLGRDGALCPTVGSRVVDTAAFATRTREAGAGHVIPVDDASWFSDGYGIVSGDLIQLAGGSDKYRVVEIAETADTIRIDRPAGWAKGDGIHLAFAGDGPDQGAFEFNGPRCANGADN